MSHREKNNTGFTRIGFIRICKFYLTTNSGKKGNHHKLKLSGTFMNFKYYVAIEMIPDNTLTFQIP